MSFEPIIFLALATMLVIAAGAVVTLRNPVHAAMSLVLTFFTSAMLWILLRAEFLGIALVLVYVGAVMVLFLFVVMMLDINVDPVREGFIKYLPVGAAVALLIVIEMGLVVGSSYFSGGRYSLTAHAADYSNTKELGSVLYTFYVYPFEIASVILLVAIVAAISLTMRRREGEGVKAQNPGEQVRVSRNDRVRLVRLASEKKN